MSQKSLQAKIKRRDYRKAAENERKLAENSNKENLSAAVKAYHLKCVQYHKALQDARDVLEDRWEPSEAEEETAKAECLAEIDKVLVPAPRVIPADSIPAQVRLQDTIREMRARGDMPAGTDAVAQ